MEETLGTCRDVVVAYGDGATERRALDGVTLRIPRDESVGLLGRSGSGKTTLLHVLGGLVDPVSGSVDWRGRPRIAYVFQGANLLPHFTAYENVAFAAHVSREDTFARDPLELLELVGLASKTESLPSELSGGEAQRVAIARALAQGPELLLCDEPTGHLDSDTSERVLDLIGALRDDYGFALVIATHDPGVAARLDREVELHDGRIVREAAA